MQWRLMDGPVENYAPNEGDAIVRDTYGHVGEVTQTYSDRVRIRWDRPFYGLSEGVYAISHLKANPDSPGALKREIAEAFDKESLRAVVVGPAKGSKAKPKTVH